MDSAQSSVSICRDEFGFVYRNEPLLFLSAGAANSGRLLALLRPGGVGGIKFFQPSMLGEC